MLKFDDKGLIPAIVQDARNGEVLMLGYMNKESLKRTLASGDVWFYSRSRQELWHKGETSGNFLRVKSIIKDCDSDTLLVKVEPTGPVCHTGNRTCFFQQLESEDMPEKS
jgi:phosphoribosyl-AMP cyclohydrolase